MSTLWLLLMLIALELKLRWRWRAADKIGFLHEIGALVECDRVSQRGVLSQQTFAIEIKTLSRVVCAIGTVFGVIGFLTCACSLDVGFLFVSLVLGGGWVACWLGWRRAAGSVRPGRHSVHRGLIPCRFAGRMRLAGCRFGWSRRLRCRVKVAVGQGFAGTEAQTPKNGSCRGGGGNSEADLLKGLVELLSKFGNHGEKGLGFTGKGKGKETPSNAKGKGQHTGNLKGKVGSPVQQTFYSKPTKGHNGKSQGQMPHTAEGALLEALKRLINRASQDEGQGLFQRLNGLVTAAASGKPLSSKRKKRRGQKSKDPQNSFPSTMKPKGKGLGKGVAKGFEKGKSSGKGKGKSTNDQSHQIRVQKAKHGPKIFEPARLLPKGWPIGAAMSVEKLRATLEKGQTPQGCVTWATQEQILELQTLAKTHNIAKAFALVCLVQPGQEQPPYPGGLRRPLPATDRNGQLGLGNFWAFPLAKEFPQLPSCGTSSKSEKVERLLCTLRVQVPKRLLQPNAWQSMVANPATVLRTIVDPSTFHSTFKWSSVTHKTKFGGDEEVLEGYMKIDQEGLFNVLRKSGSKGMFFTQVLKENPNPPKVSWVPRVAEETDHQYMARIQQIGHSKQTPLKFRVGGGACLGLIGVDPENKPTLWQVAGVPTKWTGQDLTRCLEGAGFTDTTVLRRPFRNHPWMVITKVTAEFQSSSVFGVESNNVCLTISKPPPKNSVLGRRNVSFGRWHEKRTHVVASALGVPENDARRDNREQTQDEQQAPKRHKADNSAPYTLVDCGGAGNCGWNSVAVGLGIKKGLTYEDACKDIETTVRTLRADVCSHVMRHSTDYKPSWAPDSGETEVTAAGAVPATFEEWAASLLRDRQWMCGMALEAAARRCGVKIVILEETNGEMLEPLVCGTGKKREDPIILYLKDEHFQLVLRQDGIELPRDWVQAKSSGEPIRINLRGAGRLWCDKTPSKTSTKKSSRPMRQTRRAWSSKTPSRASSTADGFSAAPTFRLWRKTSLQESEKPRGDSTMAPSTDQNATGSDFQFGTVATSGDRPKFPSGKLGALHEITEAEKKSRPWWTCQLCGHMIYIKQFQGRYSAAHLKARQRHLCKIHGYSKAPPLPRHGIQDMAIRNEARQRHNQNIGWKAVWEAYMSNRWPGSHRILEKGIRTVARSGYVVYKQKCQDCGAVMCRGDVPKRDPCVKNPTFADAPSRPERVKLWRGFQKCRQTAMRDARKERYKCAMSKKESMQYANSIRLARSKEASLSKLADGVKATRRNHRGEVIGEASNPGPAVPPSSHGRASEKPSLNLWSTNIRSWNKHGESLLSEATKANVQVVCCQETNLPQEDFATQMWVARQLGWNVIFIQSFGSNNGGLAVAVREPLAVVILAETSNDSGQMIQVEVHSSSVPFRLFNVYQRPGCWDPSISHPMLGLDNTPWVCCGDFNADVRSLGFGTLVGTARHTTSKHPIDGVFASEMFAQMIGGEQQSFGNDHSIAWASFQGTWVTPPGDSTIWTFRQNRQTQNAGLENEFQDREKFWVNSVCSQEEWHNCLQQDSEAIWAQWTQDFESFLVGTQQVIPAKRFPLIGAVPTLVSAGHHGAPGQTHRERELRRGIRRAREAAFLSRKGAPVSRGLVNNIAKSLEPCKRHLVLNKQWTLVEMEFLGRLDEVLKQKTKTKQEAWTNEMSNLSKATKWIKQSCPPQFLLKGGWLAGLRVLR